MDPQRFDRLIRSLTASRSRRGTIASLVGGTLGLLGLAETTARKKKHKKHKKPSCHDGKTNGGETDSDCGGKCPRCATGKRCASRDDCASALCRNGRCQVPIVDDECGGDFRGDCYVGDPATGGTSVCTTAEHTGPIVTSCAACPSGTLCFDNNPGDFWCFKLCDAP
jgi:hypothetical protein